MTDSRGARPDGFSEPAVDRSAPAFSTSMPDTGLLPGVSGEPSMLLDAKMPPLPAKGDRDSLVTGFAGGTVGSAGDGVSSDRSSSGVGDPLSVARIKDSHAVAVEALEAGGAEKEIAPPVSEKAADAVDATVPVVGGKASGDAMGATDVRVENAEERAPRALASGESEPTPEPSFEAPASGSAAAAAAAPGVAPQPDFDAVEQGPKLEEDNEEQVSCRHSESGL